MNSAVDLAVSDQLPVPKFHQIYLILREQLLLGEFNSGLPSEPALQLQYAVARVTIRRALAKLEEEGLITRKAGRGTHPTRFTEPAPKLGSKLSGLLENLVVMGLHTRVKVIEVLTMPATSEIGAALGLPVNQKIQKAVRVRNVADGPLSLITTYVPETIAHFKRRELANKPILILLEQAGVAVGRAEQSISAKLADVKTAQLLDLPVGSALLAVKRLVFDSDDRPVMWLHGLYRPDRYEYVMQLSRVGKIDAKVWVTKLGVAEN